MLNVGMVDNLEFWLTIFEFRFLNSTPGFHADMAEPCYYFFRINMSLCSFFFLRPKQLLIISLMDIHVQHLTSLCRICGDKIKDHKRQLNIY